jgi:hypothetical protein
VTTGITVISEQNRPVFLAMSIERAWNVILWEDVELLEVVLLELLAYRKVSEMFVMV